MGETARAASLSTLIFLSGLASLSGAILTVINPGDTIAAGDGCTLREAITAANTNAISGDCGPGAAGLDTINFGIPGAGLHTIQPTSALPVVTEPVIINGYSQGGSANTLAVGSDAVHLIEIDGTNAGTLAGGLLQISAGSSTVRGLVINNAQGGNSAALELITNGGNTVAGNFIGIDPTGAIARSNHCQGVTIQSSNVNTVGGLTPADRNVISGTAGCGINLLIDSASDNQVLNNYLGTNAAGTASLGGGSGVFVHDSPTLFNIIGGTTAAARNVISGNGIGLLVADTGTAGTLIEGNFIGTNAAGTAALPNGSGVEFFTSDSGNILGGTVAGTGNVIAFNTGAGVTMFGAVAPAANAVLGNSIFSNGSLGIDLNNDGVTANDLGDGDSGPNGLQNFPVITSVTPGVGVTTIGGTLNSTPSSNFLLQFFSNAACDPSGNGEGQIFLGATTPGTVTTDGTGNVAFSLTVPAVVSGGEVITGTATNLGPAPIVLSTGIRPRSPRGEIVSPGPTSEFSACFTVLGGPTATPTVTFTPGGPTLTLTPTPTATITNTPAGVPTPTPTVVPPTRTATVVTGGGGPPGNIPTLSGGMLALLGVALAGIALLLMRRP